MGKTRRSKKSAGANPRLVVALAVLVVIGFVIWRSQSVTPVRGDNLDAILAGTFAKFGLSDKTIVKRSIVEKGTGKTAYFQTYAEHAEPKSFSWAPFQTSLKRALENTPYSLTKASQAGKGARRIYSAAISRGQNVVMELRIVGKRRAVTVPPAAVKPVSKTKIAIVVDDFGYNMNNVQAFFDLKEPVTFAVLPNQPYSRKISAMAHAHGLDVILHLPLESWRSDAKEEPVTLRPEMSETEIAANIRKELAGVPDAGGVSNHQGSKSTEDRKLMTKVFRCLKQRDLYFLDSLTSPRSICSQAASEVGIKFVKRDRFLDNDNKPEAIEKQLNDLKKLALTRGKVVAICHDRKNTVLVLARVMPEMAKDGIEFVSLSELAR